MMGAHESTLVSNALAVACAKVQTEGKIDVGISKSTLESMKKLWPYLPEEIQISFKDCHCLLRNRKKPKPPSQSENPRVPPDIINNLENWIANPSKLFEIEGSSLKTTDDPLVGINAYAKRLHTSNDDMMQVRARFIKIFYHKLSQVGYLSKSRKTNKQAIMSESGLATTGIDTSLETSDGRRLSLLCLDVSSSHQRADSEQHTDSNHRIDNNQHDVNLQEQADNSYLIYLFALPKYVSYRYLRDIPMAGEKRKQAIDRLKNNGILRISHQQKLTELANSIMSRIWEPMKARISGSGFETFHINNFSAQQNTTPAISNKDNNDASTPITVSTISDSGSSTENTIYGFGILPPTEETRGTFSASNLEQNMQHTPYPAEDHFSFGLGTQTMASFSMYQNALPIPPISEASETALLSGLEQTGLQTSYHLEGDPEIGLDADAIASFSMHQNALPIPPTSEASETALLSGLEQTGLHTSYHLEGDPKIGLDADAIASFSMHQNALPIPPIENSLRPFSTASLMVEDHDARPRVHESTLPTQPLDSTNLSFGFGQGSTTSGNSGPPANIFTGPVCSSHQPIFGANLHNYTGVLEGGSAGIPASSPPSEIRVSVA